MIENLFLYEFIYKWNPYNFICELCKIDFASGRGTGDEEGDQAPAGPHGPARDPVQHEVHFYAGHLF